VHTAPSVACFVDAFNHPLPPASTLYTATTSVKQDGNAVPLAPTSPQTQGIHIFPARQRCPVIAFTTRESGAVARFFAMETHGFEAALTHHELPTPHNRSIP
jgi:hypothetical protein